MATTRTTAPEFHRSTAIPSLELRRSCRENTCYRPHTHDVLSLGLIDEGSSVLTGALTGPVSLAPGDVVVIPPGHVHSCNPNAGRWRYQMTHLDTVRADALVPTIGGAAGVRVLRSREIAMQLTVVNDAIVEDRPAAELERECRRLADVIAHAEREVSVTVTTTSTTDTPLALTEELEPVMHRLRYDDSTPGLDDLAEMVGMSRYQLIRAVKQVTGLSPVAWRQNARILEARRMLRSGAAIADTASRLGFTDQSHFHRVFRAHVAATPGAYRG
ncbi:AraC family transcriptional regulator [Corynebacterium glyciniphilum]|uniref:AraC family transcriptional regulator n=1 Tax=Corynebacterium glyciniphilum TaxID=1404244 RepID=UPI003DA088D3